MATGKELFLSYGREPEVSSFASQLKHDLERNGFSVWLDTEDIPSGSDWHGAIGSGLHDCRALIAVITKRYIASRYCTSELYTADGDQKLIFPVIFEDVDYGSTEKAKGVKYVISGINWTMFRQGADDYTTSLGKLIQGMREQGLGGGSGSAEATDSGTLSSQMANLHLPPSPAQTQYGVPPGYRSPSPLLSAPLPPGQPPQTPPQGIHGQGYPSPSSSPYYPYTPGHPQQYQTPPPPHMPPQGYYYHPHGVGTTPPVMQPAPHMAPLYYYQPSPSQSPGSALPCPPNFSTSSTDAPPPNYQELYPGSGGVVPKGVDQPDTSSIQTPPKVAPRPRFKVGMKLEAVDRRFPYFVCVATIMDRTDEDIRVHFDGWGEGYDYLCRYDDVELHPVGWCEKNSWELQTPQGQPWKSWKHYLSELDATPADDSFFTEDQLAGPGSLLFRVDMKIEAKNRQNPSSVGVATIANIKDGQLLVHFDGKPSRYDYWCRPDSNDIHPAMWSGKNGRPVQPPQEYYGHFKWSEYLSNPSNNPAPAHVFTEEQRQVGSPVTPKASQVTCSGFAVGMKLEAKDRLHPSLMCVATITKVQDGQLLIHFDGWGNGYDYWCSPKSQDIHPSGWCRAEGKDLQAPNGMGGGFQWISYLQQTGASAAPPELFTEAQRGGTSSASASSAMPHPSSAGKFKVGMKIEAKDRQYPTLTCVATIQGVREGQVLVHFDGWSSSYDYWCPHDSTDIHPKGWCSSHGYELQLPKGMSKSDFNWNKYIKREKTIAAPEKSFTAAQKAKMI